MNQRYGANPDVGKYIGIYFAIGIGAAVLSVAYTLILWIFCSIEVSAYLSRYTPPHAKPTDFLRGTGITQAT